MTTLHQAQLHAVAAVRLEPVVNIGMFSLQRKTKP
jgi:hypothetical protein